MHLARTTWDTLFLSPKSKVITHCVAGERACLLPALAVLTPLQRSSQGPCENNMLIAKTSDAKELLGACSTQVLWFPLLENKAVIYDLQGCH